MPPVPPAITGWNLSENVLGSTIGDATVREYLIESLRLARIETQEKARKTAFRERRKHER